MQGKYNKDFSKEELAFGRELLRLCLDKDFSSARKHFFEGTKSTTLRQGCLNYQNEDGMSALHISVMNNEIGLTRLLLENNANPDLKEYSGKSPVFYSIISNKLDVAKALLDGGASITQKDNGGIKPYMYASEKEMIGLLIKERPNDYTIINLLRSVPKALLNNSKSLNPLKEIFEGGKSETLEKELSYFDHYPKVMQDKILLNLESKMHKLAENPNDKYNLLKKTIDKYTNQSEFKLNHPFEALSLDLKKKLPQDLLDDLELRVKKVIKSVSNKVLTLDSPIASGVDLQLFISKDVGHDAKKVSDVLNETFDGMVKFSTVELTKTNDINGGEVTVDKLTYELDEKVIDDRKINGLKPLSQINVKKITAEKDNDISFNRG